MEQDYDEISLREIIEILLRGKKIIVLFTFVAVLISGFYSFLIISPTYEVTTSLIIKDIEGSESTSFIGTMVNDYDKSIDTMIGAFNNVIEGPIILEKVRAISPEWEAVTSDRLTNIIKVSVKDKTSIVDITVSTNTADDSVALANIAVERFLDFIDEQNYDLLYYKVNTLKMQLSTDISLLEGVISNKEEELAKLDKVFVYKKSITDDPYLQDLVAEIGNTNVVGISNLSVQSEEPNSAYIMVLNSLTSSKLELVNLNSQYNELLNVENQLEEISKTTGIKGTIVHEINRPENPVSSNKMLNLAIGAVLGIMLGAFLVFFLEYWRNSKPKSTDIE